ncbi:MAG TPA: TPM domain-containing protein, partial [Usitatibacter sp.]|nr:TPM domain-containing protein [Usitatibacter sp.]
MRRFLAALALLAAATLAWPQEVPVPKLTGHVVDLTSTLGAPQRAGLDAKLVAFEQEHGSQVVVLLVPTIGSEAIEEFAGRVTDEWKLGRKGVDDGVLFVVAKDDHKMRIQTGRGVQGTLTDALSKRIVADLVAPHFRGGDFSGGIEAGTDAIIKAIEGEKLPLPAHAAQPRSASHGSNSLPELALLAFFLIPILGTALRGAFGRFFGAAITSGIAGVAVWFLVGSVALVILGVLFAFFFSLVSRSGLGGAARPGFGAYVPGGWGVGGGGG